MNSVFVLLVSVASLAAAAPLSPIPDYSGPYVVLTYGDRDNGPVTHECQMMMGKVNYVRTEVGKAPLVIGATAPAWSTANEVSLAQWSRLFSAASKYPSKTGIPEWSLYPNRTVAIHFGVVSETDKPSIDPAIDPEPGLVLPPSIFRPRDFYGLPAYIPRVAPTYLLKQNGASPEKNFYLDGVNSAFIAEFYPSQFCGSSFDLWVEANQ